MAEIFLSYRRQDSQSATGRLADDLEAHFGDQRVFRDREIAAGENFVEAIRRSVESSTVVLAVVGRRWLDATDSAGRRRLDDPADFVRLEIELALAARVPIVPVLVEGATMPSTAELPPTLEEFSRCQAVELSDARWRYDCDRLIEALQSRFAIDSDAAPLKAGGTELAGALTRAAADVLDLTLHPKRLMARRQTGGASDHGRAFVFLVSAIVVGNVILLLGIDLPVGAGEAFAESVASKIGWLLAGLLVGVVFVAVLAALLALAWRIVDRRVGFGRVWIVAAYVYSGAWIGFCLGAAVLGAGVELIDPGFVARAGEWLHAAASSGAPAAPRPQILKLRSGPLTGAAVPFVLLGYAIWIATIAWSAAAWGAFRQTFGATRLQGWTATSLWLGIFAALVWAGLRLR
jgi:hypothetical protein